MKQAIREELLNRGLTDMLQLVEMASVTKDHLDGSVGKDDLVQTTTEVIRGLLGLGYAVFGDVIEDEGLLCVRPWELSLEDTIERIKDEWRALGGLRNLGEVGWLELTESGREEATRSPA